jgi:hypothetical protein
MILSALNNQNIPISVPQARLPVEQPQQAQPSTPIDRKLGLGTDIRYPEKLHLLD